MGIADRQMRRAQMRRDQSLDEQTRHMAAMVEIITRRFLQGLLTAHARNQPFRAEADDEMTLLCAWQASEFLDACGFTVGVWYHDDAKVYTFTTTTAHTLAAHRANLLPPPWLRIPDASATSPDSPRKADQEPAQAEPSVP